MEKLDELALLATAIGQESTWWRARCARPALPRQPAAPAPRAPRHRGSPAGRSRTRADQRNSPFLQRQQAQRARLRLPLLPTTTIGSFPQTLKSAPPAPRWARRAGRGPTTSTACGPKSTLAVRQQEALGIDVLVHGEAERNDMVEYFGEQLDGFAFTQHGWVQSYGSRCVKPHHLRRRGRPAPMTVAWTQFAQSLTDKPLKGMLTGPITLLRWSFVRDDQPRSQTAEQIAWAIRDGCATWKPQALPSSDRRARPPRGPALPRAAGSRTWPGPHGLFASVPAACGTPRKSTRTCAGSEFNDILPEIAAMDADVITIETSRSDMELLQGFGDFQYPNEIGPGVYDIHSPRVPGVGEMTALLQKPPRSCPSPTCGSTPTAASKPVAGPRPRPPWPTWCRPRTW